MFQVQLCARMRITKRIMMLEWNFVLFTEVSQPSSVNYPSASYFKIGLNDIIKSERAPQAIHIEICIMSNEYLVFN